MPLKSKFGIYKDTLELTKELFRGGNLKANVDILIKEIFKTLKEINEKEEEYSQYKR